MNKIKLGGIIEHKNLHLLSLEKVPDRPGLTGLIFRDLGRRGIAIPFILQCRCREQLSQLILGVADTDSREALAAIEALRPRLGDPDLSLVTDIAVLSIFGPHFRERPGIAGVLFEALGAEGVPVLAVNTSMSTCSCVIPAADLSRALRRIGEAFDLPGSEG